jgi:hypothetical protein
MPVRLLFRRVIKDRDSRILVVAVAIFFVIPAVVFNIVLVADEFETAPRRCAEMRVSSRPRVF